jgi:hypothetical protein
MRVTSLVLKAVQHLLQPYKYRDEREKNTTLGSMSDKQTCVAETAQKPLAVERGWSDTQAKSEKKNTCIHVGTYIKQIQPFPRNKTMNEVTKQHTNLASRPLH